MDNFKIQKFHQKLHQADPIETEFVIVIDVIRAFTTAAYAFDKGAEKIILVSLVQEALDLKKDHPEYLLMGEVGGELIPGFDFCNSPVKVWNANLKGKTLVQRTSAGTQGVIRSIKSKKILCSSFVVANATYKRIQYLKQKNITFLITGGVETEPKGDEDRACADYLEKLILENNVDSKPYLQRVINSPSGQKFANETASYAKKHDLEAVLQLDKFSFAMEIFMENNLPVLRAIKEDGNLFFIAA
jgi:2-phosphosulfolactate phosphatase